MTIVRKSVIYLAVSTGALTAIPVLAQNSAGSSERSLLLEEVVVTARRRDERLQDVPISMTVFSQQDVSKLNIVTAGDLATYTPSLSVNNRFGEDNTTFSIRGFTEEMRTTASVGVYFSEVIGPRGSNTTSSGNGAGPGAFFDLQNVQVLKGPQGTLFGRNTTGGAVLIVPQKPTDELGGYVEASAGDFGMRRLQGVVNVPINDNVRLRLGIDDHERDGYLKNEGDIGPSRMANLDYTAYRASLVVDITDSLENYTILNYTDSSNKGSGGLILECHPDPTFRFASFCQQQMQTMSGDFHGFKINKPEAESSIEQWQVINHLTWEVNDNLTIKNILSYTELETDLVGGVFATSFSAGGIPFTMTSSDLAAPGVPTTNQNTFVGELQALGTALDDRLDWQAGLYLERSKPGGTSGSRPTRGVDCLALPYDTSDWACLGILGPSSSITRQWGKVEYDNRAVYGQATYSVSDSLKLTAGLRYTWDETTGVAQAINYTGFPMDGYGPPGGMSCISPLGSLPD
ncbi:MAG: TonB-dependent receptor, partial [Bacteroidales bacterium]|nr:TonB-dependent receptor [Bacteroidales bacterium]